MLFASVGDSYACRLRASSPSWAVSLPCQPALKLPLGTTVCPSSHPGREQVERLLALGASRSEATADLVGRSVKLAMTPSLNTMSVVGLVSIPGALAGM